VAKFRGDQPRELGDYALKKIKKNIKSKTEDLPLLRTGGLTTTTTTTTTTTFYFIRKKYKEQRTNLY